MKRAKIMEPLPNDLLLEIFSRMPAKSVARFRTLSKQWAALLHSPDFTKLFLTRSSSRPRLLLGAERNGEWLFFSSLQPHNRYEKSSHLDYHTKFSGDVSRNNCSYASGLIYFPNMWFSKDPSPVICNPVTGMYESLPDLMRFRKARGFLGIDPIDKQKQFKVLSEAYPFSDQREHHKILSFGTGELSWRSDIVSCPVRGEVVLCMKYTCTQFYVFYFNPERNTLQSVEIQGFGANLEAFENRGRVYAFVNHVEDLSVNDAKQLKSSISKVMHLCGCCNKVAQPNYHY